MSSPVDVLSPRNRACYRGPLAPDTAADTPLQERNIAHAELLCEQATTAAVAGDHRAALTQFQQALFYRPNYAKGHEMRAQVCLLNCLLVV